MIIIIFSPSQSRPLPRSSSRERGERKREEIRKGKKEREDRKGRRGLLHNSLFLFHSSWVGEIWCGMGYSLHSPLAIAGHGVALHTSL